MIKVEWFAAGVLLILRSRGLVTGQICRCRICTFIQPTGNRGLLHLPMRSDNIMTKNMQITLSSRVGFAFTARNTKLFFPGYTKSENFKKLLRLLFRLRSTHAYQIRSNPSCDPVPFVIHLNVHRSSNVKLILNICCFEFCSTCLKEGLGRSKPATNP